MSRSQAAAVLGVLAVVAAAVFLVGSPLVPFVLAVVLAYICAPLVSLLERMRVGRTLGATLVVLGILALLLTLPLVLLPLLALQVAGAVGQLPALLERVSAWGLEQLAGLGVAAPSSLPDLGQLIKFNSSQLSGLGSLLGWFGEGVAALATLLGVLVIAPLVTFYLLRDWPVLLPRASSWVPAAIRPGTLKIAAIADQALSQFLRGQLGVMAIMAVIFSVLLSIAATPSALGVGFVAGMLSFIPYVGFGLSLVLALAVSFADFTSWAAILWTVLAMLAGTSLESFVITPRIIGSSVGLGPVAVLLALTVMGSLFGFVGILLAIPVASVLLALWRYYLAEAGSAA